MRKTSTTLPCLDDTLAWLPDAVYDAMAIVDDDDDFRFVR